MLLRCTWLPGYVVTGLRVNGVTRLSGYTGVCYIFGCWLLRGYVAA